MAADPLTPVPVAAACNPAFVIPSGSHWAAVLGDNRLPPPPWKPCRLGWGVTPSKWCAPVQDELALRKTARHWAGSDAQEAQKDSYVNPVCSGKPPPARRTNRTRRVHRASYGVNFNAVTCWSIWPLILLISAVLPQLHFRIRVFRPAF